MVELAVLSILIAGLIGIAVGCSMMALIEWLHHVREVKRRVRTRLDFAGRNVGGRNRLMDAAILDQRPEWGRHANRRNRQSLNGKKTMEARWGG